jgi:tetratricopeptide (TPR) repeat protein
VVVDVCGADRRAGALKSDDIAHCAVAHNNRGLLRRKQGDAVGAVSDFDEALAIQPKLLEALINRGSTHMLTGTHAKALADLNRAVALEPSHGKAHFRLGLARAAAGLSADASRAFQKSCSPGYAQACERVARP